MGQLLEEEVVVLVKAIPQVGSKHGETVCCAGVTRDFQWRRLYPVRFRHLDQENKFARWQFVGYRAHRPERDTRDESRRIYEESIVPRHVLPERERAAFIGRLTRPSAKHAQQLGQSLTIVRPKNFEFSIKPRKPSDYEALRRAYAQASNQTSWLDKELAAFDPPKFHFRLQFEDADGKHQHECGDWETIATFTKWRTQYGEERAIRDLTTKYNEEYQSKGMVVALGTMHKRPRQWILLGIIRADETEQRDLF
jgi:hypothetical protein